MLRALLILLSLILYSEQTVLAAEQWIRINSSNFELFTTAGEKKGREAVLYFEQVRGLFETLSKSAARPAASVRIIAFRSEKEYHPYRINEFATAYYHGGRDRDYIVMRNIEPENYPVAIHEYSHLIVQHAGLTLPVWLNEGLADVYSTLKSSGKQVKLGDLLPGRLHELQTGKWLPLEALLAVDHKSPFYNEKDKAGMFYAESWALTHMLYLSDEYWKTFGQFLSHIRPGDSQAAVFHQVYGKSLEQLTVDLQRYLRGTRFNAGMVDIKLEKSAELPEARPATALESGLALADLLTVIRKREEAKAAYESLAIAHPKNPEIELGMAHLAWMDSDHEQIQRHFARAIELGTTNAKVYFDYAMMLQDGGAKEPEISTLLRKAVTLNPDLVEAHYMLGFYAMNASRFGEAVAELSQVKKLRKEQAFPYFRAMAYANYRLGRREEAKKHAESAVRYAVDPKDVELAKELLAYVSRDPSQGSPDPQD